MSDNVTPIRREETLQTMPCPSCGLSNTWHASKKGCVCTNCQTQFTHVDLHNYLTGEAEGLANTPIELTDDGKLKDLVLQCPNCQTSHWYVTREGCVCVTDLCLTRVVWGAFLNQPRTE